MKRQILHFALVTVMAFMMVLPTVHSAFAQSDQLSRFRNTETVSPDTTKGEVSVTDNYLGDTLFKRTTKYSNGFVSTIEFHPNGLPKAEMIVTGKGLTTIKLFAADGEGLMRVTLVTKDKFEISDYRSDGSTVWMKQTLSPNGGYTQYFDDSGKLKLKREFGPSGHMFVTVYDQAGLTEYKQTWIPTKTGFVLDRLEEPLDDGTSRRVFIENGKVDHCDYLDSKGAVSHTELGSNLTIAVEQSRLMELAPDDDPTIPKDGRIPQARLRN